MTKTVAHNIFFGGDEDAEGGSEARKQGVAVFGVTVDVKARDYFPYLFGPGGGAIIPHIENLPSALLAIFRNLLA